MGDAGPRRITRTSDACVRTCSERGRERTSHCTSRHAPSGRAPATPTRPQPPPLPRRAVLFMLVTGVRTVIPICSGPTVYRTVLRILCIRYASMGRAARVSHV